MISLKNKFAACTAIAALGAVSLFAAETSAAGPHHRHMGAFLSSQLNLTPAQQTQAKAIFQGARQSAQPVRQQLKQTRQSLRAAVQANNVAQIQQLATNEGSEVGQLATIRGTAMAKVYQILTPDQQQKLAALRQARRAGHHSPAAGTQNN
ncbi:MAG: Spy/CpxP family protein refolding chaperone [Bryobacteraceae bacterium]|jgi:Spy/CpxP family protein refolding chaperone